MKITIGQYELNITGKDTITDTKNNEDAVMYFLNELVIAYQDAEWFARGNGFFGQAEGFKEKSDNIFQFLNEKGFYDR